MKLVILAVGRGRAAPEQTLANRWLAKLPQGGELIEVESKLPAGDARRMDEGQRLLRHCPDNIPLIACDPLGHARTLWVARRGVTHAKASRCRIVAKRSAAAMATTPPTITHQLG